MRRRNLKMESAGRVSRPGGMCACTAGSTGKGTCACGTPSGYERPASAGCASDIDQGATMGIVLLGVFGFFALAFIIFLAQNSAQKNDHAHKLDIVSRIPDFDPKVKYDGLSYELGVAIDPERYRFAIISADENPKVFGFSQLVAVEVDRDGVTVTTTKGSNGLRGAAVGLALIGPLGLALGGTTKSKSISVSKVKKLALKIYVNDLSSPFHEVVFFKDSTGSDMEQRLMTLAAKELEQWFGRFQTIIKMQDEIPEEYRGPVKIDMSDMPGIPAPINEAEIASRGWLKNTFGA